MTALPRRRSPRPAAVSTLLAAFAAALGCAATPNDPAVGGGGGSDPGVMPTPFASHGFQYPAGSIRPTGAQADLDAAVASFYDRWRAAYVREGCGGFYVRTG